MFALFSDEYNQKKRVASVCFSAMSGLAAIWAVYFFGANGKYDDDPFFSVVPEYEVILSVASGYLFQDTLFVIATCIPTITIDLFHHSLALTAFVCNVVSKKRRR